MIGYFIKSGGGAPTRTFEEYVWGPRGFDKLIERLKERNYGTDMKLLLIQYYVPGDFEVFGPDKLTVRRYTSKSKDIAVAITVPTKEFHYAMNEPQQREYVVNTTLDSVRAVRDRLGTKKLDINFAQLIEDVQQLGKEFTAQ